MNEEELSRLCRLVTEPLSRFTIEQSTISLTKEIEKDILIALSGVHGKIQLLAQELVFDSANYMEVKVSTCSSTTSSDLNSCCKDHECLTKVFLDIISFLPIRSLYVQHLASNVLVAICRYLVELESSLERFLQLSCLCLELTLNDLVHYSGKPKTVKALVSCYESSGVILTLKSKLKNANWSLAACILQVLRDILKLLKQNDNIYLEVYMNIVSCSLEEIPWQLLNDNSKICSKDVQLPLDVQLQSRIMFCGNLIQLFCSLVEECGSSKEAESCDHPIMVIILDLIPMFLDICLGEKQSGHCMFGYLRHKILMLMIRVNSNIRMENCVLVLWLQLIHKNFEDLLLQPMTQEIPVLDCLEGSPFHSSSVDVRRYTYHHLQRLVVFLVIRCSFSLVELREPSTKGCDCTDLNCLTSKLTSNSYCCGVKGLNELYWWMQEHLPPKVFPKDCTKFTMSFIRLFINEDDILFEVLLLVLSTPFFIMQTVSKDKWPLAVKDDILLLFSVIFNPIHMFHLFLAELHYDHQLLIDYLISKDDGVRSAEYLLRSLRLVCNSWDEFGEFLVENDVLCSDNVFKLSGKKRKVPIGGFSPQGHPTSETMKKSRPQFENAKDCLLLLKKSLEKLQKKNLFPYNPESLLRRLVKFQELTERK